MGSSWVEGQNYLAIVFSFSFSFYFVGEFCSHYVFPLSTFMHYTWVPKMALLSGLIHFASYSPKLCLRAGVGVHAHLLHNVTLALVSFRACTWCHAH